MIHKLSASVINQIAAGEVVENPASVVKELMENSIDAGAKNIRISIWEGGYSVITVEDDGVGMSREDALLCLERYATSKINSTEDLLQLSTMGFRGEALAAIASISHVKIKTCNGDHSTALVAQAGVIQNIEPCARNRGTTIEIRSLFFNMPARKKFQKSPVSSSSQIKKWVEIIAAAHPEVAFTLLNHDHTTLDLQVSNEKERTNSLFGPFAHDVLFKSYNMSVSGSIGSPSSAKQNRAAQFLYINQRPITSPLVSKAVKAAFATRIGENLHPAFVLFLQMDPALFDVNVHPQKKEVRFQEEGKVFCFFQEAVEKAFSPVFSFPDSLTFSPQFSFQESFAPTLSLSEATPELDFVYKERPLAILGHFLLLEAQKWILVDLKAAHARVIFENLQNTKVDKVKKIYTIDEGMTLWRQVQKCLDGYYDPSGNPIFVTIEEKDLAKWIGSISSKNN